MRQRFGAGDMAYANGVHEDRTEREQDMERTIARAGAGSSNKTPTAVGWTSCSLPTPCRPRSRLPPRWRLHLKPFGSSASPDSPPSSHPRPLALLPHHSQPSRPAAFTSIPPDPSVPVPHTKTRPCRTENVLSRTPRTHCACRWRGDSGRLQLRRGNTTGQWVPPRIEFRYCAPAEAFGGPAAIGGQANAPSPRASRSGRPGWDPCNWRRRLSGYRRTSREVVGVVCLPHGDGGIECCATRIASHLGARIAIARGEGPAEKAGRTGGRRWGAKILQ
ncbi:hypothetical protein C8J57DRAFT_1481414 [Mycena rebaudengoi]|nr:hypothetical protein C8J57DRAFT_1481414 [Mycena rebaudengoi]